MKENRIEYQGRLTEVPDVIRTNSGKTALKFTLAYDVERYDKDTGKTEKVDTDFMRCIHWTESTKFWLERLGKGKEVIVKGFMRQEKWETEGGDKRSSWTLNVKGYSAPWLTLVTTDEAEKAKRNGSQNNGGGGKLYEDDIPF